MNIECFVTSQKIGDADHKVSKETVVNLISNTTTNTELTIQAQLDDNEYQTGIKVSEKDFDEMHILRDSFHGEWNYSILPQFTSE